MVLRESLGAVLGGSLDVVLMASLDDIVVLMASLGEALSR